MMKTSTIESEPLLSIEEVTVESQTSDDSTRQALGHGCFATGLNWNASVYSSVRGM